MRKKFAFYVFFMASLQGMSQGEWINFDRDYFKIPTARHGVYQLDYLALSTSGIDMNRLNPRDIRVYHRGKEIPIYINGEEDGSFDIQDYIQFFGKGNDGALDRLLYDEPEMMPNPYYNTHSDTTAYFLTITPGISGKRIPVEPFPQHPPSVMETYLAEYTVPFNDQYSLGRTYEFGSRISAYDRGQGWMGHVISLGNKREYHLDDLGATAISGTESIDIGLVGRSEGQHLTVVSVGPSLGTLRELGRYAYRDFDFFKVEAKLSPADFNRAGGLVVVAESLGNNDPIDNISLSYIKVKYAKAINPGDFGQETFIANAEGQFLLSQIYDQYVAYEISTIDQPKKVELYQANDSLAIPITKGAAQTKVFVQKEKTVTKINAMEKFRFRNILQQPANYMIISHKRLRNTAGSSVDPIRAYGTYRASAAGGAFDTLSINVDELYNQFSFGEKSPLAILEFLKQYRSLHRPEYLLLIGRSLGIYNTIRLDGETVSYRKNPTVFAFQDLLPAAGYPYSDNLYAVGLDRHSFGQQEMAVGRIPAKTPEEVEYYLEKVKEKDALGVSEDWQKNIAHLSGGRSAAELERYYNYLNGFKTMAEDIYLGGGVTTVRKTSGEVVEMINISEEVNEGVSLVTFFGHSAPSVTDIDIGFASAAEMGYDNKGRYPLLLLNGCDAGNAFGEAYTFGEDWVLTPEKGASLYMAHSSVGVDVYLRRYSECFYDRAFTDSSLIYQTVGKIKIEAEKLLYQKYGDSPAYRSHVDQMILLGDPAVRLFPADKADYAIDTEDIFLSGFGGLPSHTLMDSLHLSFVVRNKGRVNLDSVDLDISRQLPDGTLIHYDPIRLPPVYRRDTISFTVPNTGVNSFGENFFTIEINKQKGTEELTYMNNVAAIGKFIQRSGTLNLAPMNFSIVSQEEVELIVQIPGISTEDRNMVIQIDTVSDFSSPARRETIVTTRDMGRWRVPVLQHFGKKDSVTFYWRSKFREPKIEEGGEWSLSSFSYIDGSLPGWTQRRLPQFSDNPLDNVEMRSIPPRWEYQANNALVEVFTFGAENPDYGFEQVQVSVDEMAYLLEASGRHCADGSLGLMAFDHQTLVPYLPIPLTAIDVLDEKSCGRTPQLVQNIRNIRITGAGETMLLDYIKRVNEGDYVIVFSIGEVTFSEWPEYAYREMKRLGANEATLRNLKSGDPYILFGRKGMNPGEAKEIVSTKDINPSAGIQVLTAQEDLRGFSPFGNIISPRIGPASDWIGFFTEVRTGNYFNDEGFGVDILGISRDGEEIVLVENTRESRLDLQSIDPLAFPYLKLKYKLNDPMSDLPAQLQKWQVNYSGVPEGVLLLKTNEEKIHLDEGEEAELKFEFLNISEYDFPDSLTVRWSLTQTVQKRSESFTKKIPAVKAGDVHEFSIAFNSLGWPGKSSLHVYVNPEEYMEHNFRNNLIDLPDCFVVVGDDQAPRLDVRFDGVTIMDGDMVSPTALISILLKDENSRSLKKDTVGMDIFLKRGCENCDFQRVNFSSGQVTWFEATEARDFEIEFEPGPLEDGFYTLRVNGSDAAGNQADEKPYEVSFEVVNASQITNFYPYPNPFSSNVRFVFTVTGVEIPDEIKIQITTITGKVVREIFQEELGPIRIGHNISDYAWDGKDEFGDQLANGVYLYRVLVRKDGQFMERRSTAGDRAFRKGYGKVYLLR